MTFFHRALLNCWAAVVANRMNIMVALEALFKFVCFGDQKTRDVEEQSPESGDTLFALIWRHKQEQVDKQEH